ncbi:nuclear transport factor 2 family protein [uncultured Winogradskyella sp.]|uniref:nuclear transport factor 2 family protein n=1 Tax=uncultured Winogradskyella sp. TaxID=395353 RepID=UPI00261C04C7|nr:nuclear transport factor 2 family protein [uncultured Winogradskyella sp.]
MKNVHPNISILKQFDPANITANSNIIAKDAVFHYFNPLLPDFQGDYIGIKGFEEFFKKMAVLTRGTFKVNPISISPVGNELVVVHTQNTLVIEDQHINTEVVVVWRIVEGKIKEVWDIPSVYT